jgi:hypothetical protein
VYRIPLVDGRVYIGYAKDPHVRLKRHRQYQKGLPDGHPRKWWQDVPPEVQRTMRVPVEWQTWYRSKPIAEERERRAIREALDSGVVVLANRVTYKTITVGGDDE